MLWLNLSHRSARHPDGLARLYRACGASLEWRPCHALGPALFAHSRMCTPRSGSAQARLAATAEQGQSRQCRRQKPMDARLRTQNSAAPAQSYPHRQLHQLRLNGISNWQRRARARRIHALAGPRPPLQSSTQESARQNPRNHNEAPGELSQSRGSPPILWSQLRRLGLGLRSGATPSGFPTLNPLPNPTALKGTFLSCPPG